jgi:hypothetical protein
MNRIPARSPWSEPATTIVSAAASLPDAACQREGAPGADEWFQAEGERTAAWTLRQQRLIQWHCASCPVMRQCRRGAVERGEQHGVWGGLTEAELRQVQLVFKRDRAAGVAA